MTNQGLASKKVKRSGLLSASPAGSPVSGRDMSIAAARMPSFDFASSTPSVVEPGVEHAPGALPTPAVNGVVRINIELLVDSPFQPRLVYDESKLAELAESLQNCQIDPVVVRPAENGRFEIISGHRRKRAAPLAQLDALDCRIIHVNDAEAEILVLAANEPREDFADYERALAYARILEHGKAGGDVRSQRQLAAKIGVDVALINRRLSMLDLPDIVQDVLRKYPWAFSCRWTRKLLDLTQQPFDAEQLKAALFRVATGELQMTALFSVMSHRETKPRVAPQSGLSLHRESRLFAQVMPNSDKRQIKVSLPGDCDVNEVAELLLAAIKQRYASE